MESMRCSSVKTFVVILSFGSITALLLYLSESGLIRMETNDQGLQLRQAVCAPPTVPRKILLLTYPRSGSSFTGHMLDKSPGMYYVFEPLHALRECTNMKPHACSERKVALLRAFFTCNFPASALRDMPVRFLRHDLTTLRRCSTLNDTSRLPTCLKNAERECRNTTRVTIKTIRLSMRDAGQLLASYPDLAVIFLVRDPRASMLSRMKTFSNPRPDTLQASSRAYCTTMRDDLEEARSVLDRYPDRIRFVRYERLADNPFQTFRNMYAFLRLDPAEAELDKHIEEQTGRTSDLTSSAAGMMWKESRTRRRKVKETPYSVSRSNSAVAARHWRAEMSFAHVRTMEEECSDVLELLGYRRFKTQSSLRNITMVPSEGSFTYLEQLPYDGVDLSP